jgi:hypothetical protein
MIIIISPIYEMSEPMATLSEENSDDVAASERARQRAKREEEPKKPNQRSRVAKASVRLMDSK